MRTDFASVEEGARELASQLAHYPDPYAFTAHTAAGLDTGYGFRADRAYVYADPDLLRDLVNDGHGAVFHVYKPDRPLDDTQEMDGTKLASKEQVLLDLAGMGRAPAT